MKALKFFVSTDRSTHLCLLLGFGRGEALVLIFELSHRHLVITHGRWTK